jgi:uncharacterized protein involved in exopolysaccharide biosynthesis
MIEQGAEVSHSESAFHAVQYPDPPVATSSTATIETLIGIVMIETLTTLARNKWLIAKITGAAVLAGVVICLALPVRYTATARIMTPRQSQSAASLLMDQLTSSAIIQRFELAKVYSAKNMTAARKKLKDNTQLVSEKSGMIAVSVEDRDKNRAAEIANAYPEQLRLMTQTLAVTEASQRRLFYERELPRAKEDLIGAELSFEKVQQDRGIVHPDAQARALIGGLADLQGRILAKQVELQSLRSYSTEHNPAVQLAENQIASLQEETARLNQGGPASRFSDLGMQGIAGGGIDYLRAQHEVQYRQVLFDMLLKQYDAARLDEAKEGAVIQTAETAIPPEQRSSPHRAVIVVWCTMLGLLGSWAFILVRQHVRQHENVLRSIIVLRSSLFGR